MLLDLVELDELALDDLPGWDVEDVNGRSGHG